MGKYKVSIAFALRYKLTPFAFSFSFSPFSLHWRFAGERIQWDTWWSGASLRVRFGDCLAACEGSVPEAIGESAAWHADWKQ